MNKMDTEQLLQWDRDHVWHPYTSALNPPHHLPVSSASGVRLKLADGRELIDGMASWWCAIHGYNHPALNAALHQQIDNMSHVMFGGLTHAPAVQLCRSLVEMTPADLSRVFLSDSGSVAVEVALKMALQYWQAAGRSEKQRFIALRSGYHGDTLGAMSVCDPVTGMHHLFSDALPKHLFLEAPARGFHERCTGEDLAPLTELIESNADSVAAVILEPVVQGAGGMRFYSPDYLVALRRLCDQHGILLIFDEIATGFGRTGKMFALEHAQVTPDILCLGKALTGGYLSLAATLCTEAVAQGISAGEAGAFMHGPTFMGNPLACSAANASLELLKDSNWASTISSIEALLERGLSPARDLDGVADVRCLGAIGVIELEHAVDMSSIQPLFADAGVWVRPFGRLVYTMPPYVMEAADLDTLTRAMVSVVKTYLGKGR